MGSLIHLLFLLLIGLAAGWLAGQITKGKSYGLVNDLIVGVFGAFLGGILFWLIGLSASNLIGSLITATVGAIVFLIYCVLRQEILTAVRRRVSLLRRKPGCLQNSLICRVERL